MLFFLGLVCFFGLHALPFLPSLRQQVIRLLGGNEQVYKIGFGIIAIFSLLVMGVGKSGIGFVALWGTHDIVRYMVTLLSLIAVILITATYFPNNLNPYIRRYIRHPMLVGVLIWALSHAVANGDIGSLVFFGAFAIYAGIAIKLLNQRDGKQAAPATHPVPPKQDLIMLGTACGIFIVLFVLHGVFFGQPVFP